MIAVTAKLNFLSEAYLNHASAPAFSLNCCYLSEYDFKVAIADFYACRRISSYGNLSEEAKNKIKKDYLDAAKAGTLAVMKSDENALASHLYSLAKAKWQSDPKTKYDGFEYSIDSFRTTAAWKQAGVATDNLLPINDFIAGIQN